jgi:hypothetical protein
MQSVSLPLPVSGEQLNQIAPRLAQEGDRRLGDVGQVADDPTATQAPSRAAPLQARWLCAPSRPRRPRPMAGVRTGTGSPGGRPSGCETHASCSSAAHRRITWPSTSCVRQAPQCTVWRCTPGRTPDRRPEFLDLCDWPLPERHVAVQVQAFASQSV